MNKICERCDTRCRLKMCDGRDGDFKYCFRRTGSTDGLKETITPFNTLHELYEKQPWLDWIDQESLLLSNEPYGDTNMVVLWGSYKEIYGSRLLSPCGFVTVEDATKMDPVVWSDEV